MVYRWSERVVRRPMGSFNKAETKCREVRLRPPQREQQRSPAPVKNAGTGRAKSPAPTLRQQAPHDPEQEPKELRAEVASPLRRKTQRSVHRCEASRTRPARCPAALRVYNGTSPPCPARMSYPAALLLVARAARAHAVVEHWPSIPSPSLQASRRKTERTNDGMRATRVKPAACEVLTRCSSPCTSDSCPAPVVDCTTRDAVCTNRMKGASCASCCLMLMMLLLVWMRRWKWKVHQRRRRECRGMGRCRVLLWRKGKLEVTK